MYILCITNIHTLYVIYTYLTVLMHARSIVQLHTHILYYCIHSAHLSSLSFGESTFSGRRGVVELKTLLQPLACWCFRPLSTMYCPAPTGFCGTREGNRQKYTRSVWQHSLCRDCMWYYTVGCVCVSGQPPMFTFTIFSLPLTNSNRSERCTMHFILSLSLYTILAASLIATFTKSPSHMTIVRPPD